MNLKIKLLDPRAKCPIRATPDSAGLDLFALEEEVIPSGLSGRDNRRMLVRTGIAIEIPPGWCGLVIPRSGIATKKGVTLTNSPGLIDADYRGEVKVAMVNLGAHMMFIQPGDRIAQLLITPYFLADPIVVDELSDTDRGEGGFGSTGHA